MIFVAFWFAQSLKVQYSDEWLSIANWLAFGSTAVLTIILFIRIGLYRAVTRFVSIRVLTAAAFGSIISAVLFCLTTLIFEQKLHLALPIVYFLVLVVGVTSSRMILRAILTDHHRKQMTPVIIYGAGQSGRQLLEAIKQVNEYSAIAFVDDNPKIQRTVIYDLAVYNPNEIPMLISRYGVRKILLAIPSSTPEERKDIIRRLEAYKCEVLTIPGMKDLVDGKINVSSLKKISVVDLLGRAPVAPRPELMSADISDKVVMVTGAGGSIGSELCRQILNCRPTKLLLFELSEFALYSIDKELRETQAAQGSQVEVVPLLGSVQNKERLSSIMKAYHVDTVYHAAAYKHSSNGRVQHYRRHSKQRVRHTLLRAGCRRCRRFHLCFDFHRQSRPSDQHHGCQQTHGRTLPASPCRRAGTKNTLLHGTFRQCIGFVRLRCPCI